MSHSVYFTGSKPGSRDVGKEKTDAPHGKDAISFRPSLTNLYPAPTMQGIILPKPSFIRDP